MDRNSGVMDYDSPTIVELGTFTSLTATSFDGGLHFAQVQVGSIGGGTPTPGGSSTPVPPPGGGVLPGGSTNPAGTGGTDNGAVLGETATGTITTPSPNGTGGGTGTGAGPGGGSGGGTPGSEVVGTTAGGSLPFTGFAVGTVAWLGAAATTVGVALRRATRRL